MNRILVIEDNNDVRENICEILALDGYNVNSAMNGKIGVQQAIDIIPDIIICDVMMPELDGFGVLKILSKNVKTKNIPFIFLTAKTDTLDFRKGMGLGADDYITKPFGDTDLLDAIEIRLKKRKNIGDLGKISDRNIQHFFSDQQAEKEFQNIMLNREVREYKTKDIIVSEGAQARWLYFVMSGSVNKVHSNDIGKELIIHTYKSGDYFGYLSLLTERNYQEKIIAMEQTKLKLIPAEEFKNFLFSNLDFSAKFIKELANITMEYEHGLVEMAYSSVRRRVSNALLAFAIPNNKNEVLEVNVSRENLASSAGTAKETLIRTLSDFKNEKLIENKGKSIIITNKKGLESMPQ